MSAITVSFVDKCVFEAKVRDHAIKIDLPANLQGTDTGPMPPELFVLSLASCMGYYALFHCRKNKINFNGIKIEADYEKATNPDRVSKISIKILIPGLAEEHKKGVMEAAKGCLVHQSLIQQPEISVSIE
ncbi:MAG: OsmC family protein [Candidatus Omnitrophica bacterium]|nr:OsmC family protein [Candidatus Omnitrophota bacterium]MCM8821866.1 OsmC family protein [Candidatus Omnitrophota bacterium]MCM8824578.1 OsmC family protein [Candidatus Omnitrophota bacterium]MCM8828058.1 OsmC family protein [Candidatus Omnitrophota bacterium]